MSSGPYLSFNVFAGTGKKRVQMSQVVSDHQKGRKISPHMSKKFRFYCFQDFGCTFQSYDYACVTVELPSSRTKFARSAMAV